jgi:hypothetical protein
MESTINIAAEMGSINHKLRHLRQLELTRVKLVQKIVVEALELSLGEECRFIFDLPLANQKENADCRDRAAGNTSERSRPSGEGLDAIVEQITSMQEITRFLETKLESCVASGRISTSQLEEIGKLIELTLASTQEASKVDDIDGHFRACRCCDDLFQTASFRDVQAQWDAESTHDRSAEVVEHLSALRSHHKAVLAELAHEISRASPFKVKLS